VGDRSAPPDGTQVQRPRHSAGAVPRTESLSRHSNGLSHFCQNIHRDPNLQVLDLGGLSELNVRFLSRLGCRIHALDLLVNFDEFKKELPGRRFEPQVARAFVEQYLNFEPEQFHAILVWDVLEHLDSDLLYMTVSRLDQILRPGGSLLAIFHNESRGERVQVHRYQIENEQTLRLYPRQLRPLPHTFNNRSLEKLFGRFRSVKFFLTRDNLREVIAVR
jgi:hypothetical protein